MTGNNKSSENNKALQDDFLLYSVDLGEEEEPEEEEEPDGYECLACGNIQGQSNGFGCNRCSGPLEDWFC